jgi:hypothetical protein
LDFSSFSYVGSMDLSLSAMFRQTMRFFETGVERTAEWGLVVAFHDKDQVRSLQQAGRQRFVGALIEPGLSALEARVLKRRSVRPLGCASGSCGR